MIYKNALLSLIFIFSTFPAFAIDGVTGIEKYEIDKNHTNIMWYISHMGFSRTIGNFKEFVGTIDLNHDDPTKSEIYITIDTSSISSGVEELDKQLKGVQFFDVENYPQAIFESTNITLIEDDNAEVKGNFTMLGKTREITLNVRFNKRAMDPILNIMRTGYSIRSSIKRSNWGMDQMLAFVSDDINITIEAEALRVVQ
ncbi:MAG: YceI family protein [Kordiimonadaceae bacterium]|jgi:polyisoprenoid-binding protein YceI|nr:YceI family protein [Kordiimonadaceae bacterium]MBT6031689.1 YceI family protein [Kordiimonadaceae bacterium]